MLDVYNSDLLPLSFLIGSRVCRPIFLDIVEISDSMLVGEKDGGTKKANSHRIRT